MIIEITGYVGSEKDGNEFNTDTISRMATGQYLVTKPTPFSRGIRREALFITFTDGFKATYTFESAEKRDAVHDRIISLMGGKITI